MGNDIATASLTVDAPPDDVWRALTDPATIARYYFGTTVTTDWRPGSPITWAGEYEGKRYEDHGEILEVDPPRRLRHTHFSPLGGKPDLPENHHTLTYTLTPVAGGTEVTLEQDNNDGPEAAEHAASNWRTMLAGLKETVEQAGGAAAED
ncbi:MAG TPA: SRPBCC family protein [Microbacterium sp.]|uniref:SRPBCC family protein n=1 Tax=Microbacterium sp. TaxID=51671 RepID=UPI002C6131D5|nr:SRPBCC family protein [Microbacterium sp.]HWI31520.1 SRPBCC family protein [Microbacterium sp.]